jgi:predicted SAM-dependent methyltransferase
MISRRAKAAFYTVAGPLMWANGLRHRYFPQRIPNPLRVHLGPGQRQYIDGWTNVDANMFTARCDIWADMRNPLPFRDNSVDALYSHHVIEHLPDLTAHFADALRCLRPGGTYRVGGPNGDAAIGKFVEKDLAWFNDFPDSRRSIGGRFENFIFCAREHLTILTYSFLEEIMTGVGFTDLRPFLPVRETGLPEVFGPCLAREQETDFNTPHTLVIEASKPLSARH